MAEQEAQSGLKAHPAPGWMSVIRIPGAHFEPKSDMVPLPPGLMKLLSGLGLPEGALDNMQGVELKDPAAGFVGAVVIEIGILPPTFEAPFKEGDTVFFPANAGVNIGEYQFLVVDKPVAWTSPEG